MTYICSKNEVLLFFVYENTKKIYKKFTNQLPGFLCVTGSECTLCEALLGSVYIHVL